MHSKSSTDSGNGVTASKSSVAVEPLESRVCLSGGMIVAATSGGDVTVVTETATWGQRAQASTFAEVRHVEQIDVEQIHTAAAMSFAEIRHVEQIHAAATTAGDTPQTSDTSNCTDASQAPAGTIHAMTVGTQRVGSSTITGSAGTSHGSRDHDSDATDHTVVGVRIEHFVLVEPRVREIINVFVPIGSWQAHLPGWQPQQPPAQQQPPTQQPQIPQLPTTPADPSTSTQQPPTLQPGADGQPDSAKQTSGGVLLVDSGKGAKAHADADTVERPVEHRGAPTASAAVSTTNDAVILSRPSFTPARTVRAASVVEGDSAAAATFVQSRLESAASSLFAAAANRVTGGSLASLASSDRLAGGFVQQVMRVMSDPVGQVSADLEGAIVTTARSVLPQQRFFEFAHLGSPLALLTDSVANFIDDSAAIPTAVAQGRAYERPWTLTFSVIAADVVLLGYMYRRQVQKRKRQAFARVATATSPALHPFYG